LGAGPHRASGAFYYIKFFPRIQSNFFGGFPDIKKVQGKDPTAPQAGLFTLFKAGIKHPKDRVNSAGLNRNRNGDTGTFSVFPGSPPGPSFPAFSAGLPSGPVLPLDAFQHNPGKILLHTGGRKTSFSRKNWISHSVRIFSLPFFSHPLS